MGQEAAAGVSINLGALFNKLVEQSVTAAVLFIVLILFARWVKKQIEYEREDKTRCYDMHEKLQTSLDNNTRSTNANCQATNRLVDVLEGRMPKLRSGENPGGPT